MDSLQLKLCDIQGRLFELFAGTNYEAESLVKDFMEGEIAKNLDSEYNRMQWAGEEYLLEELIATNKNKFIAKRTDIPKNVLFWMGYVYRYWHPAAPQIHWAASSNRGFAKLCRGKIYRYHPQIPQASEIR